MLEVIPYEKDCVGPSKQHDPFRNKRGELECANCECLLECIHFWQLTPPSQGGTKGTSVGVCKFCQEGREFPNDEPNEGRPGWQHTRKNQGVKVRY